MSTHYLWQIWKYPNTKVFNTLKASRAVDNKDNCIQWTQDQIAKKAGVSVRQVRKELKACGIKLVADVHNKQRFMLDPDKAYASHKAELWFMGLVWHYASHPLAVDHRIQEHKERTTIDPKTGLCSRIAYGVIQREIVRYLTEKALQIDPRATIAIPDEYKYQLTKLQEKRMIELLVTRSGWTKPDAIKANSVGYDPIRRYSTSTQKYDIIKATNEAISRQN